MKGYELYSWELNSGWHFTLITGTNRNKTLEEIISGDDMESKDGWVRIHALGTDGIIDVLSRVPKDTWVSWNGGEFVLPTEEAVVKLILPPADIVNQIKDYAVQRGFTLYVMNSQ